MQLLDDYNVPGLLVCATNLDSESDTAIWRRFDDILEVPKPGKEEIKKLIETTLAVVKTQGLNWKQLLEATNDYSAAQIVRGCINAMKSVVLAGQETVITVGSIAIESLRGICKVFSWAGRTFFVLPDRLRHMG